MKPEEQFHYDIWWALKEIKRQSLYASFNDKDEFFIFDFPNHNSYIGSVDYCPGSKVQHQILEKLVGWGLIKKKTDFDEMEPEDFASLPFAEEDAKNDTYVEIQEPKFSEALASYNKGLNINGEKTRYIGYTRSKPIIRPTALEYIAKEAGELMTGMQIIRFLRDDCSVDEVLIEYPETKWKMFYKIFIYLAESNQQEDHDKLLEIIQRLFDPILHNGDLEQSKLFQEKVEATLKFQNIKLSSTVPQAQEEHAAGEVVVKVSKQARDLFFVTPDDKLLLHSFRNEMGPENLMKYLFNNLDSPVKLTTIRNEVEGMASTSNLSETIRACGFNSQLKKLFFPICKSDKLQFRATINISKSELKDIVSKYSRDKS